MSLPAPTSSRGLGHLRAHLSEVSATRHDLPGNNPPLTQRLLTSRPDVDQPPPGARVNRAGSSPPSPPPSPALPFPIGPRPPGADQAPPAIPGPCSRCCFLPTPKKSPRRSPQEPGPCVDRGVQVQGGSGGIDTTCSLMSVQHLPNTSWDRAVHPWSTAGAQSHGPGLR